MSLVKLDLNLQFSKYSRFETQDTIWETGSFDTLLIHSFCLFLFPIKDSISNTIKKFRFINVSPSYIACTDLFPVWVGGSVTRLGKQFVINTSPITLFITRPRVTTLHHQPGINDKQTTKRPSEASGQPGLLLILTSRGPWSHVISIFGSESWCCCLLFINYSINIGERQ